MKARERGWAVGCLEDPSAGPLEVDVDVDAVLTGGDPALFLQADDVVVHPFLIEAGPQEGMLFFPRAGHEKEAPNSRAVIAHNTIAGRGWDGFRAQAGTSSLIGSVLCSNRILGNGRYGIRIEVGGNTGNRIEHNRLAGNGEHDCHDNTAASGGNHRAKNRAVTESIGGLGDGHG